MEREDLAEALGLSALELEHELKKLEDAYEERQSGIMLKRFGDRLQLATRPRYAPYIERLLQPTQRQNLSKAALETLSVIAYRQPCTRADIEAVRGVKCDYSVSSLLAKGLIQELGRKETLGRPILYGTAADFLVHFGLTDLTELPRIEDLPPEEETGEELVP